LAISDPLPLAIIIAGVLIAIAIVIYAMRRPTKNKDKQVTESQHKDLEGLPFKVVKSVPRQEASTAKDELRLLDLEREILSDAIRRLYEAQAEGKITEQERERLAQVYKGRMMTIREAISKDESLVALHELETMQEDLIKLFSDRFSELTTKIEDLRSKVEVEPIKEVPIPIEGLHQAEAQRESDGEKAQNKEEKTGKKRRAAQKPTTPRTEAEKRIEEIREEVEKVLDRLGQMEVES
jgi:hypothetical protein